MTPQDFSTWQNRLFIMQPSLLGWLKANSPDYRETLKLWFKILKPYRLDECLLVLDEWSTGIYEPPKAYERDNFALHVRAAVELKRDRKRKEQEQRERLQMYKQRSGFTRGGRGNIVQRDPRMAEAYRLLKAEDNKRKKGLISVDEYETKKAEILEMVQ